MARVVITKAIKQDIANAIDPLFLPRRDKLYGLLTQPVYKGKFLLDLWLDAEPGRRELYDAAVSAKFLPEHGTVNPIIKVNGFQFRTEFYRFAPYASMYRPGVTLPVPQTLVESAEPVRLTTDDPEIVECVARISKAKTDIAALDDEQNAFTAQVNALLDKHSSLNDAVKEWPDLEALLYRDTVQRLHYKPPARSPKPKPDPISEALAEADAALSGNAIDTSKLTTTLVASKMINSTLGGENQ